MSDVDGWTLVSSDKTSSGEGAPVQFSIPPGTVEMWVAEHPLFPGIVGTGATRDEAIENASKRIAASRTPPDSHPNEAEP